MSPSQFYRQQAIQQQSAADAATLQNVRERCQRAANAWDALATRGENADSSRAQAAMDRLDLNASVTPDRGLASG